MTGKTYILIVEDEKSVAQALWRALSILLGEGYVIECCKSAEGALERIDDTHFDLLIADLRLPGINGLELVKLTHQRSPDTRSMLITAYGSPQIEEQARKLTDAYVPKPFLLQEMGQIVRRVLYLDEAEPEC